MRLPDCSEAGRRASLRGIRARERGRGIRVLERKRHAWVAYIWRTYGLEPIDVARKWEEQGGLCPICLAPLETKVWVIEHRHVKGFKRLPANERAPYFRGIVCAWDNHRVLSMAERGGRERGLRVLLYLGWAH